eukprot:m.14564 g.14564  ORF g.14564 m.14564 type:complete len:365 (+) comp25823_c0_seq2:12-1106(+)
MYRKFRNVFFIDGWGSQETLSRLLVLKTSGLENFVEPSNYPVIITETQRQGHFTLLKGQFVSPLAEMDPGLLPKESEVAKFEAVLPKQWASSRKPMCIHLAGTGDHYFWRRKRLIAGPLAKEKGIGSILLENPYYGCRKPSNQFRSALRHVSDIFAMGVALAMESTVLLNWCLQQGYGPLGITGISMGGHMASIASCFWRHPLAIVPCLSWSTASAVFTEGVLKDGCAWNALDRDMRNQPYAGIESALEEVRPLSNFSSVPLTCANAALSFMNELMDLFTHLTLFPRPDPRSSIISVVAKDDRYFPRENVSPLSQIWPECEIRLIPGGHIYSYLFNTAIFRKAISDAFDRLATVTQVKQEKEIL